VGLQTAGTIWSVRVSRDVQDDAGMSLVETVVALFIISVGVLALLTELVNYMHAQVADKARAGAVRYASQAMEDAREVGRQSFSTLTSTPSGTATYTSNGVTYSAQTSVQLCTAATVASSCTPPGSGQASVARVTVTVTWPDGENTRQVSLAINVAQTDDSVLTTNSSGALAGLVGGSSSSDTVTLGALSLSPSSAAVNSSGTPASAVTATLSAVGLNTGSSLPLTWSDDNGSHQVTMTHTTGSTWSATVPAASITKVVADGSTGSVTFAATVPGGGVATSHLTLVGKPTFVGTCRVTPNPIVFQLLTTKTSVAETLQCTTSGLTSADSVSVSYPTSTTTTATAALTTSNGSTWTVVLPVGTKLKGSPSETFTFGLTRVSDGVAGTSQSLTVLAA